MTLLYKIIFICGLLTLVTQVQATAPNWTLNPADFSKSMNIIARVQLNGIANNALGNKVGVFVGNTLRGTANPAIISGAAYYFITVYSNQSSGDTLHFQVYTAADDVIHPAAEILAFQHNGQTGTVPSPFWLSIYTSDDFPISIEPIPAQQTLAGVALPALNIAPYLNSTDNDPVVWTVTNSAHLHAVFTGSSVVITPNDAIWTGVETITVTATETGTISHHATSQTIQVTVLPNFVGPDFQELMSECIPLGGAFTDFDLDNFLTYTGSCRTFDHYLVPFIANVPAPVWIQPGGGSGSMNVVAEAKFGKDYLAGTGLKLAAFRGSTLVGVAMPVLANNKMLYFLSAQNIGSGPLSFKFYHPDNQYLYAPPLTVAFVPGSTAGTIVQPVAVQLSPLVVNILADGETNIEVYDTDWTGSLTAHFQVIDCNFPLTRNDDSTAVYSVGIGSGSPSISISISQNDVCPGTPVTFTAQATNGGTAPTYQWQLDGNPVGTNSSQYSSSTLPDGGMVVCYITTSGGCVGSATAASNAIEVHLSPAPTLTCPSSQSISTATDACNRNVTVPLPTVQGSCTEPLTITNSFNQGPDASGIYPLGITTVIWTAVGTTQTIICAHTIRVSDNIVPTVVCKNTTLNLNAVGFGILAPADVFQSGVDNCGTVNLVSVAPNSFACSDLGPQTVTLTANDGHGNNGSCVATVTVAGLTLGNLVYQDFNNNGSYDAGTDAGIGGVVLHLYADEGDNVLDITDGAPIATTTTAPDGTYSFPGLCVGSYLVEVAASNFVGAGVLANGGNPLTSSEFTFASDPDTDTDDNDDNGEAIPGFGVAAPAFTFAGGTINATVDFGFVAPSPLPLDLRSFTGQITGRSNVLYWQTATEKNVSAHLVERSADGRQWAEVGRRNGQLNAQIPTNYTLEDQQPLPFAYYRLRSVDVDGSASISKVIVLDRAEKQFGIRLVSPNPATDLITVQFFALAEETVRLQIMDVTGRLMQQQTLSAQPGLNVLPWSVGYLPAGVYILLLSNDRMAGVPLRMVKE